MVIAETNREHHRKAIPLQGHSGTLAQAIARRYCLSVARRAAHPMGLSVLAAIVAAAALSASTVSARSSTAVHMGFLKTPSRSVYCDYEYGGATKSFPYVRCGFKGMLVPPEAKPHGGCGVVDYVGNRMLLHQTGRGKTEPCAGDAGPFANPKAAHTVPYGSTWHGGPFTCTSSKAGMLCRNSAGHGFLTARRHWRVF
jgi:hypothetical protein